MKNDDERNDLLPAPPIGAEVMSAQLVQFVRIMPVGERHEFRGPVEQIGSNDRGWKVIEIVRQGGDNFYDYAVIRKGIHRAFVYLDSMTW